eukprot:gb/GECG01003204.1/.p2 GENE.gb/GECG01003204.1/~~gb/GECG01003204.1/.p2  ORF type:complete len:105 (-),score=0.74 gb/GECG01003204.1/:15-329(-)
MRALFAEDFSTQQFPRVGKGFKLHVGALYNWSVLLASSLSNSSEPHPKGLAFGQKNLRADGIFTSTLPIKVSSTIVQYNLVNFVRNCLCESLLVSILAFLFFPC